MNHLPRPPREPHQQRVLDERSQLSERFTNLSKFLEGATFSSLDSGEQNRLRRQRKLMSDLRDVLDERIEAWSA